MKQGILYVSAAGPLSNVALALLFGYFLRMAGILFPSLIMHPDVIKFIDLSIMINIGISFFNLLPVPPLDGSKILLGMLPDRLVPAYIQKSRYLPTVFIVLLILEWGLRVPIFSRLIYPLFTPYYTLVHSLIFWRLP